jgi:voltage-gated sodium channel
MEEKISSSERGKNRIVGFAQRVVSSNTFDWIITGVILLQAFALAIEATPALLSMGKDIILFEAETFRLVQSLVVSVFIVEAALATYCSLPKTSNVFQRAMELL